MAKRVGKRFTLHRKKTVDDRTRELEALEVRIRETEERLRDRQSRNNSPVGRSSAGGGSNSPHRRHPPGSNFNGLDAYGRQPIRSSPLAGQRQPRDDALDTDQAATGAGSQAGSAYNGTHRQSPSGYRKPVGSSLNQ